MSISTLPPELKLSLLYSLAATSPYSLPSLASICTLFYTLFEADELPLLRLSLDSAVVSTHERCVLLALFTVPTGEAGAGRRLEFMGSGYISEKCSAEVTVETCRRALRLLAWNVRALGSSTEPSLEEAERTWPWLKAKEKVGLRMALAAVMLKQLEMMLMWFTWDVEGGLYEDLKACGPPHSALCEEADTAADALADVEEYYPEREWPRNEKVNHMVLALYHEKVRRWIEASARNLDELFKKDHRKVRLWRIIKDIWIWEEHEKRPYPSNWRMLVDNWAYAARGE